MKAQLKVSLKAVAREMDVLNDEWTAYINRRTGELVTLNNEAVGAVEDGVDEDDLPDGQADELPKIREVLASEDFLPLPSKFDIDEYEIMEQFCRQVEDAGTREDLLSAIQGTGAFRRFRSRVQHWGLLDGWYAFRERSLEDIAASWLEENGIEYTRETAAESGRDA